MANIPDSENKFSLLFKFLKKTPKKILKFGNSSIMAKYSRSREFCSLLFKLF
jgi:hypothetical protein